MAYTGPTFVGLSSAAGSTNPMAVTFSSSGLAADDLLLLAIETANQAISAPTGFTQTAGADNPQGQGTAGAAGGVRGTLFEKVSDGTETSVAIGDSGNHQYAIGLVVRPSGGASGCEVAVLAGGTIATGSNRTIGGVTTTDNNCLIVTFAFSDLDGATGSWNSIVSGGGANVTERFDNGTSAGAGGGIAIWTAEQETAGTVPDLVVAASATSVAMTYITVAIRNVTGAQLLTPTLYANSQTFYGPTVTLGAVSLVPTLLTNAQTFYSPTVAQGQSLLPGILVNGQTFHAATVTRGTASLAPPLLANAQTFPSPSVTFGAVQLLPGLVTNTQTFYEPTVTAGDENLDPPLLSNAQTFYSPAIVVGSVTVQPPLLLNDQTFYDPIVTIEDGPQFLLPELVANDNQFFGATVTPAVRPSFGGGGVTPVRRKLPGQDHEKRRHEVIERVLDSLEPKKKKKRVAKPTPTGAPPQPTNLLNDIEKVEFQLAVLEMQRRLNDLEQQDEEAVLLLLAA